MILQILRRLTWPLAFIALILAAAFPLPMHAAAPQTPTGGSAASDLFSGLKWRNIGPFHGGRISAHSEPGIGSTFTIELAAGDPC